MKYEVDHKVGVQLDGLLGSMCGDQQHKQNFLFLRVLITDP